MHAWSVLNSSLSREQPTVVPMNKPGLATTVLSFLFIFFVSSVVPTVSLGFRIFFSALSCDMNSSSYFLRAACPTGVLGIKHTGFNDLGAGDLEVDDMHASGVLTSSSSE